MRQNLIGQKFGNLTVIKHIADYIQPSGQHKQMVHCICDCGKECDVRVSDIKSGNTTSCGCQSSRNKGIGFEDLTGKQFGRLIVLYRLQNHITPSGQSKVKWMCKCECGKEVEIYASELKKGRKSCGCKTDEQIVANKERIKQLSAQSKKIKKEKLIQKLTSSSFFNEWNYEKNIISPKSNKLASTDKYWWKCIKGHEWQATLNNRFKGTKCPYCFGSKLLIGINDLQTKYPDVATEWHPTKNGDLTPSNITCSSGLKVWWLGKCGHEWEATVYSRNKGNGCPYCSNHTILEGFNDFKTWCINNNKTDLLEEWNYEKNDTIKPEKISPKNNKKVWWKDKLGHEWESTIGSRASGSGCPYCGIPAKRVLKGFNDLQTKYPEIAKEWHPTKNGDLTSDSVLCGSSKKIWWLGKCGHDYEQSVVNRVNGNNCPYCSHQKLLVGFNDFATTNPEMLDEWDYEKNDILPSEISVGVHKKIWWKCPFGHNYQSYPSNRCGKNHSGCPICDKENHTSFPEQALFFYIKKYYPDAINSDNGTIGIELDIYIPSFKIAIEYDGKNWHKNNKFELKKNKFCKNNDIFLIRIREEGLALYDDCYCIVRTNVKSNNSLNDVIKKVLFDIDNISDADIDVDRDSALIYSSYITVRKSKSLANTYPNIAKEWHSTKNGEITPEMVAPMSNKKFWWECVNNHEWQASVCSRVNMKSGCPICSGQKIVSGINDLLTQYPDVCEEWYYEKNNEIGIFPDKIAPGSDKKVWWKCKTCEYVWQSTISSRTRAHGTGCPECGKKANLKTVICVETGIIYESLKDAENKTEICYPSISNCCRGKQKTAGGYHWKYLNDDE